MGWRLARSLIVLREEINSIAPGRSKVSDGTIGDPEHASRCSRHNPNSAGVVCALDVTDDPVGGCPIHEIARRLVKAPHPNLEYVISNGEIARRKDEFQWRIYTGTNKHTKHAHFAVGRGPDCKTGPIPPYDDQDPWGLLAPVPPVIVPPPDYPRDEESMAIWRDAVEKVEDAFDRYGETLKDERPDIGEAIKHYGGLIAGKAQAGDEVGAVAIYGSLVNDLQKEPEKIVNLP